MKARRFVLILSLAGIVSAHGAVDLTPVTSEFVLAGIKATLLNFKEKGHTITYAQPPGWHYAGGADRIRFTPPQIPQAFGEIDQSPLAAPQKFDEWTTQGLHERTLAAVPPDSQKVTLVSEERSPLLVSVR